jgi:hypothetical protein
MNRFRSMQHIASWAFGSLLSVPLMLAALVVPLHVAATVINFDGGDGDTLQPVGEDYAAQGVHFGSGWVYYDDNGSSGSGGDYPAKSDPNSGWGSAGAAGFTITFDAPVSFFAFWFNNNQAAKFNAWPGNVPDVGSCVLCDETLALNVPDGPDYVSYSPASPIRSMHFFANDLTIDDFEFRSVPEPSTLALLGLGLAGLGFSRRKQ